MLSSKAKTVLGIILAVFGIAVLTLAIVLLVRRLNNDDCEHAAIPLNLNIRRANDNKDLEISWFEPWPNYECDVTYILTYWINDGDKSESNVTGDSLTIYSLSMEPCSVVTVELRAISEAGNLNEFNKTNTYTEFPRDAAVTDIQFTNTDQGLSVTWARPVGIDACDISYQTFGFTDRLDTLSSLLDTERFDISDDLFCFRVYLIILTIFKGQIVSADDATYEEKMIQQVNFEISPEDPQELIISWDKHYKYELCELDYHVEYSSLGIDDQFANVTEPEARFRFLYCANANVTIQTYGLERSIAGPTDTFDDVQLPSAEITTVQNINFGDISDNMLVVSWLPSVYPSYCDIIYTVSAENPITGEKNTCTGTTNCKIRLADFCPNTEIVIRASLLNDEVIDGKPATSAYNCTS